MKKMSDPYADAVTAKTQHLLDSNMKLKKMNDKLSDEVASLRSQFDQATNLTAQLEKLHSQNTKASAQLRKVTAEKEDLEKRLEINIQLLDELKAASETERAEFEAMKRTEIQEVRATFNNDVQRYERTIANLKEDNTALLEQLKAEKSETERLKSIISSIVSASSSHFLIHFKSVRQLLEHLTKTEKNEDENKQDQQNPVTAENTELKEATRKLKAMKRRVLKERAENQQIRNEMEATQKKFEKLKAESRKLTSDLEERLADAERRVCAMDAEHKLKMEAKDKEISALNEKVTQASNDAERARDQLEKLKSTLENETLSLQAEIEDKEKEIREVKTVVAVMKRKSAETSAELEVVRMESEKISRKNTTLETQLEEITKDLSKKREQCDAGDLEIQGLSEKYETTAAQLEAAKTSLSQCEMALAESERKREQRKKALEQIQALVDNQKQQIDEVMKEKTKLVCLIEKQNAALQTMEKHCADVESSYKSKSQKIKAQRAALAKLQEECKAPNHQEIPLVCWCSPEFPKELCLSIKEIAQNSGCPTTAKLKHVLELIAKFYNQRLKASKESEEAVKKDSAAFSDAVDKLLVEIGCLTGDNDLSVETFMRCSDRPRKTVESLRDMKDRLAECSVQRAKHEKGLQAIFDALKASSVVQAITIITELQKTIEEMKEAMNTAYYKNKKQKKAITSMKRAVECEINDKQRMEQDLHTTIRANLDETKKLKRVIHELRTENDLLKMQKKQITEQHSAQCDSLRDECNSQIKDMELRLEMCEKQLEESLAEKDDEITALKETLDKQQKETLQWKRAIELLKKAKFESEQKLLDNICDNEEAVKAANERAKRDAEEMKSQFQKTLDHFKSKNSELRTLVSTLSSNLRETEQRNKELSQQNTKLTQEKQTWQSKCLTVQQEQKNERQLMEAKVKAIKLSESTQRETELGDAQALFDKEKKKIHTYVANTFPRLFDPRQPLTDESFRALITSISAELRKYQKQDTEIRRLLGLTSDESCEDAITKLMMTMYRQE